MLMRRFLFYLLIFGVFAFFDDCFVLLAQMGNKKTRLLEQILYLKIGYNFVDMNHFFG